MIKKLNMHIWSTTPAIADNIKQLQDKINELVDRLNNIEQTAKQLEDNQIKNDQIFDDFNPDY